MGIRRSLVLALTLVLALAAPSAALAVNGRPETAPTIRAATYLGSDRWDSRDGTWTTAPELNGSSSHTFASLGGSFGYTVDEDWFKVSVAETGTPVTVNVKRLSGQGGSYIDVYAADGSVAQTSSIAFGASADPNDGPRLLGAMTPGWWASGMAKLYFVAPAPGTYYFRHRPAAGAAGTGYDRDAIPNAVNEASAFELRVIVGDADRLAGTTRYGTSVAVSRQMWNAADDPWWLEGPWGQGVILVSGQNFADGLAATSMSLRTGMPILLTPKDSLPAEVAAEISRLAFADRITPWNSDGSPRDNTFTVYIAGSEAAISPAVESAAEAREGVTVKRLEGSDRFGTAAAIADEAIRVALYRRWIAGRSALRVLPTTAFVINGNAWADGLAAGPVAAFGEAPVLMVTKDALPSATRDWIVDNGITEVHVVGGPSVVSTPVLDALAALSTTPTVDRIAGANRYETAHEVANFGVANYGMAGDAVTVVSGASPWDALSAGQLSFMTYAPLLLTPRSELSPSITDFYDDHGGFHSPSYVVGGEPAVDAATYGKLRDLWKRPVSIW